MASIREKIINQITYYTTFAFFVMAKDAHKILLEHEKLLGAIYGKNSDIIDMIYNPVFNGTKSEFEDFLAKNGYIIDWKGKMNSKSENIKEDEENVGG